MKIKRNKISIFVGVILVVYFIVYVPQLQEMHGFCITPYFLRYNDFGFISRGFMGSIVGLFFPYLTLRNLWWIIACFILLSIFLVSWFCGKIANETIEGHTKAINFLVILFCINPASIAFLFYWGNYGRMDLYMIFILIITSYLVIKNKCLWLIPCLCAVGLMIHQGFVFSYFPTILLLLFYRYIIEKRNCHLVIFAMTLVCSSALFLYLQFAGKMNGFSYEEVIQILMRHTDYTGLAHDEMVKLEYFTPVLDFVPLYVLKSLKINIIKIIIILFLISPMIGIIIKIWKFFINEKGKKWILFPVFVLVATLPKFILTVDYGRDFASIVISLFVLVFSLYAMNDLGIIKGIEDLNKAIQKNSLKYIIILILMSSIGKFEAANILAVSQRILDVIGGII